MKSFVKIITIFFGLFAFFKPVYAGLFFCNNSGQEIAVAVGWMQDRLWVSKGWYRIKPGQCGSTLLGALKNKRYYYYAESIESNLSWGGENDRDAGYFCTTSKAFYFDNSSNNCEGHKFKNLWIGDADQFTVLLAEEQRDPTSAALNCRNTIQDGIDAFANCWMREVATDKQRRILDCIEYTKSKASLAICVYRDNLSGDAYKVATCANKYADNRRGDTFIKCIADTSLSEEQARIFQCAVNNKGDYRAMGSCAILGKLTPEQKRIYDCVANNFNDYRKAGLCAAANQLTPKQRRIANCVLNNNGNYMQIGICAVGNNLTPEQEAFASCAMSTGGQPYAFAGCVGTQLTMNELQKCITIGIGGRGCFGNNNTAVKFVSNAWKDVTEGPGPSNDLLGRDGFIGRKLQDAANDFKYGAGENHELVGRNGFIGRKLNDIDNDLHNGAGENNDIVGRNGFVCKTFFGGC